MTIYHKCVLLYARKLFDIQGARWTPSDYFQILIDEIKAHGKLTVGGIFGNAFYNGDPERLKERFHGIEVRCFRQSAYVPPTNSSVAHQICIVGASRNEKGHELVYYLDPHFALDPSQPRAVLVMRYQTLCQRIGNIYGEFNTKILDGTSTFEEAGLKGPFALHAGYAPALDYEAAEMKIDRETYLERIKLLADLWKSCGIGVDETSQGLGPK